MVRIELWVSLVSPGHSYSLLHCIFLIVPWRYIRCVSLLIITMMNILGATLLCSLAERPSS